MSFWRFCLGLIVLTVASHARQADGGTTYQAINLDPGASSSVVMTGAAGGKQVGWIFSTTHALIWSGSAASMIDLTPSSTTSAVFFGTDGAHQVGYILNPNQHAAVWSGTAASVVDLGPTNADYSDATAVAGNQQVGYASFGGTENAMLWTGSASSAVNLKPGFSNLVSSQALATDGTQQVGFGRYFSGGVMFGNSTDGAVLWTGTAASAVDLRPANYSNSRALGVSGGTQAGWGQSIVDNQTHALLWRGTPQSAVDLSTSTFPTGQALAISNGIAVGWGGNSQASATHAVAWDTTALALTDLNQFLPSNMQGDDAQATGIDATGNIVGDVTDPSGTEIPFLWVPQATVPEPAALGFLPIAALMVMRRRNAAQLRSIGAADGG